MGIRMLGLCAVGLLTSCAGAGHAAESDAQVSAAPDVTAVDIEDVDPTVRLEEELKLVERLTARVEMLRAFEGELIGYGYAPEPKAQRRQWMLHLSELDRRLLEVDESQSITTPVAMRRLRENVLLPFEELRAKE